MPATIRLHQICYSTPDGTALLSDLDLNFPPGRTGLVGRNGVGKSTLLHILAGEVAPTAGRAELGGKVGLLRQIPLDAPSSVAQALGVADALALLARIETGIASIEDMEMADWSLAGRIEAAFKTCGLPVLDLDRPAASLSGGQRTRLALARLVLAEPDIILLDEPTNNLDAEGRDAVAELLKGWRRMAVVVSHDRALLRHMDAIVELTTLGARLYGGNWDLYAEQKALELAAAEGDLAHAEKRMNEIDRKLQAQVERQARRDSAGRKKAARGDMPKILLGGMKENAENTVGGNANLASRLRNQTEGEVAAARARLEVLTPLKIALPSTHLPAGRRVLDVVGLSGGPDPDRPIVRNVDLTLIGPERLAIRGPNGSGKTSLLRLLTGDLTPQAGTVHRRVRLAMLDQAVGILDPALTIRDNFRRLNPAADENAVRAALARFMFRADAALQTTGTLSGGERLRAGLACTIGADNPPELLILDEPTNHLDIDALQELEAGLNGYDGALIVVSHDADFLEAIGITRSITLPPPRE